MKLKNSKLWLTALVAVAGAFGVCAPASARGFKAEMPVAQQAAKMVPETIDGSPVNGKTQSAVASLSQRLVKSIRESDRPALNKATNDLHDLYLTDPKNMALVSWLGYAYIQTDRPRDAAEVLETARGKSKFKSVNDSNAKNLTVALYKSGRFDDVVRVYGEADPSTVDASWLEMVGSSYYQSGDYANSVKTYRLLEGRGPLSAESNANLGAALLKSKDYDGAVTSYARAAQTDSAGQRLAVIAAGNMVSDKPDAALRLLESFTPSAEVTSDYHNVLADAYVVRGGQGDLEKAIAANPTDPTAQYNVGTFALNRDRAAEAVKLLEASVAAHAEPMAYNNLGLAYEKTGESQKAAEMYVKASDMEPNEKRYAKNAAIALSKLGDSRAASFAQRAGDTIGTAFDGSELKNLVSAGKYKEASDLLDSQSSKYPDNADYFFNKGVVHYKLGDLNGAIEAYRRSLALKDQDYVHKNLGIALYENHDYVAAKTECEKYIAMDGEKPDALQNLGAVLAASGQYNEAISVWRKVLATSPNSSVEIDLADALWNSGDTQGARFHYLAVLKADNRNARAMNGMGLYALAQGKNIEASRQFRSAISADSRYYPAYNNLSIALERLNKTGEAKSVLEQVLAMKPDFDEAKKNLDRLNSH